MTSVYVSGHHQSVLASHRWRTAENSAAYLLAPLAAHLEHLQRTRPERPPTLIDIGCGPGTITLDFARLLAPYGGHVTGIDPSSSVIEQAAAAAAAQGVANVTFTAADAFALPFADAAFDVAHAHQVLQHVQRPAALLRAMRRVTAPGGLVAARDTVTSSWAWWPRVPGLEELRRLWTEAARAAGTEPDTGAMLVRLCLDAGFARKDITAGAGVWCYSAPDEVRFWADMWAHRVVESDFSKKVVELGLATMDDCRRMAADFREWGAAEDAWYTLLHGEVVCRN